MQRREEKRRGRRIEIFILPPEHCTNISQKWYKTNAAMPRSLFCFVTADKEEV